MSSGDAWLLLTSAGLVLAAGLFSAADAALTSFSRARAEELADENRSGSKRLLRLLEDPARYLNTALLLRLLCEISAIVLVTREINDAFNGDWFPSVVVTVGVMLVISFVVIGVAPRTLGRQHNEVVALWSATPLEFVTRVLGPLPRLLILVGNALTPGKGFREGPFNTETELRELVDMAEASALIESDERRMIHSVFELGDTTVREVMVPRNDVVFVEKHKNLRQTMSLFLRSGFSRVPVIEDNLDHIVGVVYLKDLVRRDFEAPDVELTQRVEEVMRDVYWVPESKPVDDLLREMQARRQHLAIVVDEYGGTAGLITIEDLLEEIVGEIQDEYDEEEPLIEALDSDHFRVDGRASVDDLEDLWDTRLVLEDDDEYDTIGGLVYHRVGGIPQPGDEIRIDGMRLTVETTDGRRVGKVLIARERTVEDQSAPAGEE
jgi:CBS domain containing-hemolysin-like protein